MCVNAGPIGFYCYQKISHLHGFLGYDSVIINRISHLCSVHHTSESLYNLPNSTFTILPKSPRSSYFPPYVFTMASNPEAPNEEGTIALFPR